MAKNTYPKVCVWDTHFFLYKTIGSEVFTFLIYYRLPFAMAAMIPEQVSAPSRLLSSTIA